MATTTDHDRETPDAVTARADRYNDLGRFAEAERILRRALRAYPDHVNLLNKLSHTLFCLGRYEEDLEVTDKALALAPDEPVLYFRRGWTMWRLNRRDDAVELARRGLELDPGPKLKLYLHQDLGRFHNWEKRHAEAFELAEAGLAIFPGDAELLEIAGEGLRRQHRYHEADPYCTASVEADPQRGAAWYGKALNDMMLERPRQSLAAFARSTLVEPDHQWRAERSRYYMGWPLAGYASAFRWSLPFASAAAITAAHTSSPLWFWIGLGLLAATFGYAVNWLHRGGRLSWTAVRRLLPIEKLSLAIPFAVANLGVTATVTALLTRDAPPGWLGLAAGLLIWPALGFDNAMDPNEGRDTSLPMRTLSNTRWWFVDDFTGHPRRQWRRLRHRLRKPSHRPGTGHDR